MNKRVIVIFLFSVLLPVLCVALIFSYKADLVLYLSVTLSGLFVIVTCFAGVMRIEKHWKGNIRRANSKLFMQTVLAGAILPVVLIFMYYLFSGFASSTPAILEWSGVFQESAMARIMLAMPLWIFSFPWAFGVNYLYMNEVQKETATREEQ